MAERASDSEGYGGEKRQIVKKRKAGQQVRPFHTYLHLRTECSNNVDSL
jgi:hypothetical protein